MRDPIQAIQRKLGVQNSFIQRSAVAALLPHVLLEKGVSLQTKRETVLFCLTHPSKDVVEEAVCQLKRFCEASRFSLGDAIDLLLLALREAKGVACITSISNGIANLWWAGLIQGLELPSPPSPYSDEHLLFATLLIEPAAHGCILNSIVNLMASLGHCKSDRDAKMDRVWSPLSSFMALGLQWNTEKELDTGQEGISGEYERIFRARLHSELVRLACGLPCWRRRILEVVNRHLGLIRMQTTNACIWASDCLSDCFSILHIEHQSPTMSAKELDSLVLSFIVNSAQVAYSASWQGVEVDRVLSVIRQAGGLHSTLDFANVMLPLVPLFALVCMNVHARGRHMLLGTFCKVLQDLKSDNSAQSCPSFMPGLLLLPAVQAVTLRSEASDRQWAPHLLSLISQPSTKHSINSQQSQFASFWTKELRAGLCGELGLLVESCVVLEAVWNVGGEMGDVDGMIWLDSLRKTLKGEHDEKSKAEKMPFGVDANDKGESSLHTSPLFSLVLCCLLNHTDPTICSKAAQVLNEYLTFAPLQSATFLPVILCLLKNKTKQGPAVQEKGHAEAQLDLVRCLASMCGHPTTVPLVQKTLLSMVAKGSPDLLRCLSLRVLSSVWLKHGKGWLQLKDTLNGMFQPREAPSLVIRTAHAACVRDICRANSAYGLELISCIQKSATDTDGCIAALGLECIRILCRDDVLDFYKAWKVVQKWHPRLPAHTLVASEWVGLMAHGELDAKVYPDKVEPILRILWEATRHTNATIRKEAYSSLASYPPDLLEVLELQRPLKDYVDLLFDESDIGALEAAEKLVQMALSHEYLHRRRYVATSTGKGGGRAETSALNHKLANVMPKALCASIEGKSQGSMMPSGPLPAGALLMCYVPKRGAGTATGLLKYSEIFFGLCSCLSWSSWTHPHMALHAWKQFISRWLVACKGHPEVIWEAIQNVWSSSSAPDTGNTLMAAAALCASEKMSEANLKWTLETTKQEITDISSTSTASCAAYVLVECAASLHASDWEGRAEISGALTKTMQNSGSGQIKGVCAQAAAWMCMRLAKDPSSINRKEFKGMLATTVSSLLSEISALEKQGSHTVVSSVLRGWPSAWPQISIKVRNLNQIECTQDNDSAVSGLLCGIAMVASACLHLGLSNFASDIAKNLIGVVKDAKGTGMVLGACMGLQYLISGLFRFQCLSDEVRSACYNELTTLANNAQYNQFARSWAAFGIGIVGMVSGAQLSTNGQSGQDTPKQCADCLLELFQTSKGAAQFHCGVVMGLGCLIGGVSHVSELTGHAASFNILNSTASSHLPLAQCIVNAIESDTVHTADPRTRCLALWVCIAAGHSPTPSQSLSGNSTLGMAVLSTLPKTGAMCPLVEHLLKLTEDLNKDQKELLTLASALRCLGDAKRVPTAKWPQACHRILQFCCDMGKREEVGGLEQACVWFCLRHAKTPAHLLGDVVELLISGGRFRQLQQPTKYLILENISSVVPVLVAAHVPVFLRNVPLLIQENLCGVYEIVIAAWRGLESAIRGNAEIGKKSEEVSRCLVECVMNLFTMLPVIDQILPGDFFSMGERKKTEAMSDKWGVWWSAVSCFTALEHPDALRLLQLNGSEDHCQRAVVMRCLVVHSGGLSSRDLVECRYWCMDNGFWPGHVALSLAYRKAPTTLKHQMLTEILETIKKCKNPCAAFTLACSLVAVWDAQSSPVKCCETHFSLLSGPAACRCLPSTLSSLLNCDEIAPYKQPIVKTLSGLYCVDHVSVSVRDVESEGKLERSWTEIKAVVGSCLCALRCSVDKNVMHKLQGDFS